jgi:hypothetical protein
MDNGLRHNAFVVTYTLDGKRHETDQLTGPEMMRLLADLEAKGATDVQSEKVQ